VPAERVRSGGRETAVRLPQAVQREDKVSTGTPRLELVRGMPSAQVHGDAIPEVDGLRSSARPLGADRTHDLLRRHLAGLVEGGKMGGGHGEVSVAGGVSRVGDKASRLWGESQLTLTRWPSGQHVGDSRDATSQRTGGGPSSSVPRGVSTSRRKPNDTHQAAKWPSTHHDPQRPAGVGQPALRTSAGRRRRRSSSASRSRRDR
jgi:hypothetical protein